MNKAWVRASLILGCCLSWSIVALAAWYAPRGVTTVKSGRSVGKVRVGMTRQAARKALGQPTAIEGSKRDSWIEETDDGSASTNTDSPYIIVDYANGHVVQIAADLPKAATSDGFSMRSTLAQIRRKFKNIKRSASYSVVDVREIIYSDTRQGMNFSFTSESNSVASNDQPSTFIVTKPGRRVVLSWD